MRVLQETYGRVGRMAKGVAAACAVFLGFFILLVLFPSKKQLSLDGGAEAGLSVVHADAPAPADSAADSAADSGGDSMAADSTAADSGGGGAGGDCGDSF